MERYSWAVGIDENTGLITEEDARLSVSALITPTGAITSRTGVIPAADEPGRVTATSPTPNGVVTSAPFRAVLQSGRGGGTYVACLDQPKPHDILGAQAADPANDRVDLIVWQQNDVTHLDGNSDFTVRHVVGEPGAVPVDPDVDGSTDYVVRARVTVPAGATAITDADVEVLPLPWTVATGGLLPVRDAAERDEIDPYPGQAVWRIDRAWAEVYDGVGWRVQGLAICSSTTDRDATLTYTYHGLRALTTDTGTIWQRFGGLWLNARSVGLGARLTAVKTTDKTVTNSAALSADAQLSMAVQASARYALTGYLIYAADSAADAKFSLTGPAGAAAQISGYGVSTAETSSFGALDVGVVALGADWQIGGAGAAVKRTCIPHGLIVTAATSGSITLSVAQVTAHASTLTLYAGSWLSLTRVA